MTSMIEVEKLTKSYGGKRGIAEVSFQVEEGDVFGFLGPNGAGKTTTIRLLMALLHADAGTARIAGLDCWKQSLEIKRLIGYVPGEPALDPNLTGGQILEYFAHLRGSVDHAYLKRLVERFELDTSRKFRQYSTGNKRKVVLIQAFMHRPRLLILDEPTSGLDPVQIVEMRTMVRALRGDHTVLLSSHILSEISQTCDRLLVIQRGEIVAQGSEQDLGDKLGGGGTIEVEVAGPSARAIEVARTVTGIGACAVIRETGGVALLSLQGAPDLRPKVVRALVQNGIDILRIDRGAARLESIFLQLTKDKELVQ